jgi:hypothetical protein
MAKRIRRPRKGAAVETYLKAARELKQFAPKLKKFSRRKTLKPHEKSQISYYISKIGRTTQNLRALTKEERKNIPKSDWVSPSIPAMKVNQLDLEKAKFKATKRAIEITEDNGREWIFWSINRPEVRHIPKTDPWKRIERLVELAFAIYDVKQMHLWNTQGIAGFGYGSPELFLKHYYGIEYKNTLKDWLLGIAFMIEGKNAKSRKSRKTSPAPLPQF